MPKLLLVIILLLALTASRAWGDDPAPPVGMAPADGSEPSAAEPLLYKLGIVGFGRGEAASNFNLQEAGFAAGHGEGRLAYRLRPYVYWRPAQFLSIRAEAQDYGYTGSQQDYNKASLYQGFADLKWPGSDLVLLRAGRQEFFYGSGFILGNNSFNDGLSFDAVRLQLNPVRQLSLDLWTGRYARLSSDGPTGNLSAAYATCKLTETSQVEAYFFRDTGSADSYSNERLDTWGARLTTALGPLQAEVEPAYESGLKFNEITGRYDDIAAYGGHLDLALEGELRGIKNRLSLGYAYGSGSKEAANGISANHEFRHDNNFASFLEYFSVVGTLSGVDAGSHHASGLQSYTLGWGADLLKELNLLAAAHYYRANAVEAGFSRQIGVETALTVTWTMTEEISAVLGYTRFFTGRFFRQATGSARDMDIGYLQLQFDLAGSRRAT